MADVLFNEGLGSDFASIFQMQAKGQNIPGSSSPSGIVGALEIVSDPTNHHENVMRSVVVDSDVFTNLGQRSEIRLAADTREEHWYCWKFMLPTDWVDDREFSVMQIHDTPDGGDAARFVNLLLVAGIGSVGVRFPSASLPSENVGSLLSGMVPLARNHWYQCCLHVIWSITAPGAYREMFVDGTPVAKQFNTATHYDDVVGPYLKLGCYDFFHGSGWGQRTAYYADIRVLRGSASYTEGMGRVPVARQRLVSF